MIDNLDEYDFENMNFKDIKDFVKSIKEQSFVDSRRKLLYLCNRLNNDKRKNVQNLCKSTIRYIDKNDKEIVRVKSMYDFDKSFGDYVYIAGVDEVGRGPLAGPIVAASVILDLNYKDNRDLILGIKDSKKLSYKLREELSYIIKDKAVCYNIAEIDNKIIDLKGIGWCNNEVLKKASLGLKMQPNLVISDGYAVKGMDIENKFVLKGDNISVSIASASIIAKVYRDKKMIEYSKVYKTYGFENNMGYGTKEHIDGIKEYGPCPLHRNSFLSKILK